jgi:hypothetical protein
VVGSQVILEKCTLAKNPMFIKDLYAVTLRSFQLHSVGSLKLEHPSGLILSRRKSACNNIRSSGTIG